MEVGPPSVNYYVDPSPKSRTDPRDALGDPESNIESNSPESGDDARNDHVRTGSSDPDLPTNPEKEYYGGRNVVDDKSGEKSDVGSKKCFRGSLYPSPPRRIDDRHPDDQGKRSDQAGPSVHRDSTLGTKR